MDDPVKRKVIKVSGYNAASSSRVPSRPVSRPASPLKGQITSQSSLSPTPTSFRPKAKVNSSATIGRKPSASSSIASTSTSRTIASTTNASRSTSPFKHAPTRNNVGLTPASAVKARITVHSPAKSTSSVSTAASPDSRQRSFTAVASDLSHANEERRRSGSFSLHHKFSSSSLSTAPISPATSSPSQSPIYHQNNFSSHAGLAPIKVKSKVSGLAKTADTINPVSLAPSSPSTRVNHSRARIASVSASHIQVSKPPSPAPSDQQIYPITTPIPAANPYRFATTRHSPPNNQHHHYQPFLPNDDHFVTYNRSTSGPTADPAVIPLPPLSPPTSALSFSSHSSLSYNTETSAESPRTFSALGSRTNRPLQGHARGLSVRSTSDGLTNGMIPRVDISVKQDGQGEDGETDSDSDGPEHKVKAKAKSNRKIADLEITNRSLLAINSSLETTKHRQAKEIRELRRKLRESRLILPPRAFQAVKSKLDHDDTASEDDEDEDDENGEPREGTEDEVYKRVRIIIEGLIESGKRALESKPEDFLEGSKGGTKVLHAEEVRMWRDSEGYLLANEGRGDGYGLNDSVSSSRPISPSHVAKPDSSVSSEGEVEAMISIMLEPAPPGLPPPITVTPSP